MRLSRDSALRFGEPPCGSLRGSTLSCASIHTGLNFSMSFLTLRLSQLLFVIMGILGVKLLCGFCWVVLFCFDFETGPHVALAGLSYFSLGSS